MNILDALKQLRDDIKTWVANNLNELNTRLTKAINNIPKFSGNYNDLIDAPNITEDESGNMVIADESGNVIFKADSDGIHTTAVSLNGEAAASQKYVDEAIANADVDLTGYATEDFVAAAIDSVKEELSETIIAESEDWKIVDNDGNIIFSIDNAGVHTTDLTLNGEKATTETYVNEAIANIDFPETDLSDYYTEEQTDEAIKTAKEEISESITSESNEWKVVDNAGNIIFSVDADGTHTTNLTLNSKEAATKEYVDNVFNSIEIPETDLSNYYTKEETETAINTAKEELSESIVSESNEWKVVDEAGNIIFSVDREGAHTTDVTLDGVSVKEFIDNITADLGDMGGGDMMKAIYDADNDGIVDEARSLIIKDISLGNPIPLDGLIEPGVYYLELYDGYDCCLVEVMQPQENQILQRVYFGPLHGVGVDKAEDLSTIRYRIGSIVEDTVTWDSWDDYSAGYAKRAFADSNGKDIVDTYATKNSLEIIQSQADNHFKNTEIHITSEEKQIWDAKSNFSGDYNDLENAPDITEDGSGNLIIADEQGNIILQSNGDSFETINLIVQNITINGKTIQEMIQDYVNEAILGGAW